MIGLLLAAALGAGIGIGVVIDSDEGTRESTSANVWPQVRTPWQLVSKTGQVLRIRAQHGGCLLFDHVEVHETDTAVTIAALSNDVAAAARAQGKPVGCTDEIRYTEISVPLKEPLGHRALKAASIS